MVGAAGFEPTTPSPPDWCAARLRHTPTVASMLPDPSTRGSVDYATPAARATASSVSPIAVTRP